MLEKLTQGQNYDKELIKTTFLNKKYRKLTLLFLIYS